MSTNQEYWDACLIKIWRTNGNILDLMQMFKNIVGKDWWEIEEPLLRTPPSGMPWKIGVKVFVAAYLEKINKRLWDQPPEKDVLLLRKLQTSKYTSSKLATNVDYELSYERNKLKLNRKKNEFTTRAISNKNAETNWGVVKKSRTNIKAIRR